MIFKNIIYALTPTDGGFRRQPFSLPIHQGRWLRPEHFYAHPLFFRLHFRQLPLRFNDTFIVPARLAFWRLI
jgi:hypothetical protein